MADHQVLYNPKLANEWIDWVEADNPEGSREKETYSLIKAWIKTINPKKIVDIGCGQGICSTVVSENIAYIGIDQSKTLIRRAKKLYKLPTRKFILGDAYDIPLKDDFADAIFSIWVWSHLKDLRQAAKEMYRVLKPRGRFLIITANPDTYEIRKTFYKSFKKYKDYLVGIFDLGGGKVLTNTTLYFHTRRKMLNAIKDSKLQTDKVSVIGLKKTYQGGLNISIEGHK